VGDTFRNTTKEKENSAKWARPKGKGGPLSQGRYWYSEGKSKFFKTTYWEEEMGQGDREKKRRAIASRCLSPRGKSTGKEKTCGLEGRRTESYKSKEPPSRSRKGRNEKEAGWS